ncbi:MAG: T9SS C-terminal target domain-containing protein, partial [Bacteroidetes bacterium]
LIGKGVTYNEFRAKENSPLADRLQLVPTFGYPASDNLLAAENLISLPAIPIGRLSVVSAAEITDYLDKIKAYESNQRNTSNMQADKRWMKNVVHVVGANDAGTESLIRPYMDDYARIARDTFMGGAVTTFNKFNTTTASTIENEQLASLFQSGFSLMTYFGHSSATALDYNLDDPSQYNNPDKYPVFLLNGCNAGNFYDFEESRLQTVNTISEKYVLAKNRGAIGMVASTHFGIVSGLGVYSNGFYRSVSSLNYNKTIGQNTTDAINAVFQTWGTSDFVGRIHAEQQTLHGDPSIKLNAFDKPDYSIESQNLTVNPNFVSIAESNFRVKAYYYNIGRAINDSITIEVRRQYPVSQFNPTGATEVVLKRKVRAAYNIDSVEITLPILPDRDKGINKITVNIDTENKVDESSETNNSSSTDITIFEDELRPVYPYNYAIVNQAGTKLIGSASNPFSTIKTYRMELDTTDLFNSNLKVIRNISSAGNLLEFDPGITYRDSTVYYWRLGLVNANGSVDRWNNASFVFMAGTETGYNQSHFFQHTKSNTERMLIDSATRQWQFSKLAKQLLVSHSVFGTPGYVDDNSSLSLSVNSSMVSASACVGHSTIFNVFDGATFKPLANPNRAFGSGVFCQTTRLNNFEWDDRVKANRDSMMRFMEAIPNGSYVVVRKILDSENGTYDNETFADKLKADEAINGSGNSLYHRLKQAGFTTIDSFNRPRIYIFIYRKGDPTFTPRIRLSEGINDRIQLNTTIVVSDTMGVVVSPAFGPAKSWKTLKWRGRSLESPATDRATVQLIGIAPTGTETLLQTFNQSQQDANISSFSAAQYPFMRLRLTTVDSVNGSPYNLSYWRLFYEPVPEGAIGTNLIFQGKDSLIQGEPYEFRVAFKNISPTAFTDSLRLKLEIRDKANNLRTIALPRKKALTSGDTTIVAFTLDTKEYSGLNNLYLAVNPDNAQPEQFFFNNYLYRAFFVAEDKYKPLLDVTFDGVHILNRDIVSAKPHIEIKLKDENRFLALNDTGGVVVKLRYPNDNNFRTYRWGTDTLQFVPASSSADNTATINFFPALTDDTEGGEYELQVSGKDRNANRAGNLDYSVAFQVFNKPMISNLLNYPNPFSTSTAFVFTITGAEVPQEFKIQIMTISGKIVKEITRQELGNLRIGTNVTDYKWDGTDTYGQKLANGVYIYRVISSLDGKKMDKFRLNDGFDQTGQDVTDQFFNKKGYGKLVILR